MDDRRNMFLYIFYFKNIKNHSKIIWIYFIFLSLSLQFNQTSLLFYLYLSFFLCLETIKKCNHIHHYITCSKRATTGTWSDLNPWVMVLKSDIAKKFWKKTNLKEKGRRRRRRRNERHHFTVGIQDNIWPSVLVFLNWIKLELVLYIFTIVKRI